MNVKEHVCNTAKKILQSMKAEEKVNCVVRPEYFMAKDPEYVEKNGLMTDRSLYFDIEMKNLVRVDDVYKDRTTFYKTLAKGQGSASPYNDAYVLRNIFTFNHTVVYSQNQNRSRWLTQILSSKFR